MSCRSLQLRLGEMWLTVRKDGSGYLEAPVTFTCPRCYAWDEALRMEELSPAELYHVLIAFGPRLVKMGQGQALRQALQHVKAAIEGKEVSHA